MIKISGTVTIRKQSPERSRSRVYFFHEGETIRHNFLWRHSRPIQLYYELLPTILRDAGATVTDEEANEPTMLGRWNQYAGCRCGCSPGILLKHQGLLDLFVTIALRSEVIEAEDTSAGA